MSDQVRIAVAGAGLAGRQHISAIAQSGTADLACIIDPQQSVGDLAGSCGTRWLPDLAYAIAQEKPDGIILSTPNHLHVENALECIAAGIPVLVEKPVSYDVASARRLVEAGEAAGVPVLTGHHRRFNPIVMEAKKRLGAGAIGQVVLVNAMCWLFKPQDYFDAPWRRQAGAGPLLVNLIHDIDLMRHLCGRIASVQAIESSGIRGHATEDTAAMIVTFDSGATGTFSVSDTIVSPWSWELTARENPAYPATEQSCYQIGGTHGSLELPGGRIWRNEGDRGWWQPMISKAYDVSMDPPLKLQIEHFCRVIRDGEEPLVSGREGMRTLAVVEAAKKSALDGRRVRPEF